jgi:hypothetical protein
MMSRRISASILLAGACTFGEGDLEVRVYGEEFIEAGIPADEFADGWAVEFDKFLVVVGEVAVAEDGLDPALRAAGFQVFDLAAASEGRGQLVAADRVPTGAYADTAYVIAPAGDAVAGNADAADVEMMKDLGFSVYVAGSARKDGATKTFAWGFASRTEYSACESRAELAAEDAAAVQLTIHGDHLFYDDLFSETPAVRFEQIALADANGDGEVSRGELEAVDLAPFANYQVGSTGITDLWHFIEHQTTTLGHIDGEGHCEAVREE